MCVRRRRIQSFNSGVMGRRHHLVSARSSCTVQPPGFRCARTHASNSGVMGASPNDGTPAANAIAAAPHERLLPRLLIVLKNYCPPLE